MEQCRKEGVTTTFARKLSICTFTGNAFTEANGATAYQSVFGRQPALMPPLDIPGATGGDSLDGREEARIREIATAAWVQAAATARTVQALAGKTTVPGAAKFLKVTSWITGEPKRRKTREAGEDPIR